MALRAGVALVAGAGTAALLLAATAGPLDPALSDYFSARSLPQAHGHNVVNVIIVDFRALDTLGEIAVVAFTLLGLLPLLAALRRRREVQP